LPGLRRGVKEKLEAYGLRDVAQVRKLSRAALVNTLGAQGEKLYYLVRGRECKNKKQGAETLRAETVLPGDVNDGGMLCREARLLADKFCYRLKRNGLGVERLTFSLQYTDNKVVQKSFRLSRRTSDFLTLADCAEQALRALHTRRAGLKALRVRAARPDRETRQLSLFDTPVQNRQRDIGGCVTAIRQKNRFESIMSGSSVKNPEG
jgi:nucleotidyltransferase/DNA polymerase involved in DNA repair